jgi:hypothetical protein
MAASVMLQATQLGLAGPDFKQRAKHNRMAVLLAPTTNSQIVSGITILRLLLLICVRLIRVWRRC